MKPGYTAVIAGTSESRNVIEKLIKEKKEIAAFVATELGTEMLQNYNIEIVEGRKNKEQFLLLFERFRPEKVYDASHPFADLVTKNVQDVCRKLAIPYERVERPEQEYEYERIVFVKDTKEAIGHLKQISGNILLTTGVKTAKDYYQELGKDRLFIRVLKKGNSVKTCIAAGYQDSHVFGENPPFSVEDTIRMIRQTNAAVLVTKDSGTRGGVPEKVAAAKACAIPVIMIRRPEQKHPFPRILVAAAGSGSGKTTITLGLMQALAEQGKGIQAYKCGPDYIDPMYHKRLTGRPSINIDPIFHKDQMQTLVMKYAHGADLGIMEGVMGFYDGIGCTTEGSTYEVASATKTPVILVISAKGIGNTLIPMIQGILKYRENTIRGVILNRCSKGFYDQIKPKIEKECGIQVVGYLPNCPDIQLKSRHLGLYTARELQNWKTYLSVLGRQIAETIDLHKICVIAEQAERLDGTEEIVTKRYPVSLAVAQDEAFCFYYEDNLRMLETYGVEVIPFSPLYDKHLPEQIQGIYLGGGYPELFAGLLEENESMRKDIRRWCREGRPVIAECGGYMYLGRAITDKEGYEYRMCGAFPHTTQMGEKLNLHFGYVKVSSDFGDKQLPDFTLWAHEFHYSREIGDDFTCCVEKNEKRRWRSGYFRENQYAAYPHLSFRGNERFLEYFLEKMMEERE